jgi:hypothetical protein
MIEKVQYADYGLIRVLMGRKMIKRLERMNSVDANKKIVLRKIKNEFSMDDIVRMLQRN